MTSSRLGIELEGKTLPCTGCFMAKIFRKGIPHSTNSRSEKKLGRVFIDLSGRKSVASIGGMQHVMRLKGDFQNFEVHLALLLRSKISRRFYFQAPLTDVRADGVPSEVQSFSGGLKEKQKRDYRKVGYSIEGRPPQIDFFVY